MGTGPWERAQRMERAYQQRKDPGTIVRFSVAYWERVLALLPPEQVRIGPDTRVLDAGCGPAGILLALDSGVRTGFDPLMDFYLNRFPHLRQLPVRWIEGRAEEFRDGAPYDLVFSINMLDHTDDPTASAANLASLLAPGGRLVLLMNTHLTRFWRLYFSAFYRLIDPPHPHHFHRDDLRRLFRGLNLVDQREVDSAWLDLEKPDWSGGAPERRAGRLVRGLINPFKYPIGLARILGRPLYRRRHEDRPLMTTMLYVFARPGPAR